MLGTYHALYAQGLSMFDSEIKFWVATISLAHGLTLALTSAGFLSLDRFPSMDKYRLQDKRAPDHLFNQAFRGLFFNSIVTYPVFALALHPIASSRVSVSGPLPDGLTTLKHLALCILVEDCLFYWIHRSLHHKAVYKYVHKTHHEFKQNVAPAAEHFHPAEDVMNVIPFITGPLVFRLHLSTLLLWVVVRVHEIVDAHSGYGIPWSPWSYTRPSERHEFHHSHNIGCYGSFFPFWDKMMGTDARFREFIKAGAWRAKAADDAAPAPARKAKAAGTPSKDGTFPSAKTPPRRTQPPRAAKSAAKSAAAL